jgi:hypothetical protein
MLILNLKTNLALDPNPDPNLAPDPALDPGPFLLFSPSSPNTRVDRKELPTFPHPRDAVGFVFRLNSGLVRRKSQPDSD